MSSQIRQDKSRWWMVDSIQTEIAIDDCNLVTIIAYVQGDEANPIDLSSRSNRIQKLTPPCASP